MIGRVGVLLLVLATLPGIASAFEELDFLVGRWSCEALGGTAEEIWLPARGDVMHGVFRLVADGEMQFSEFVQITREDDGLIMRFAHFRPDYSTWEGEDSPVELRLAETREGYARFEPANERSPEIEYRLTDDQVLEVRVEGVEEPFRFRRGP